MIDAILQRTADRVISEEDAVATVTAFTAESVTLHVKRDLPHDATAADLIICGGGVNNPILIKRLHETLPGCRLLTADEAGFLPVPWRLRPLPCSHIWQHTAGRGTSPRSPAHGILRSLVKSFQDGHFTESDNHKIECAR
ncbi:MAG: anhydro-N-acetylmuramic acid kinase [Candidatus Methylomirabilis sp.]|nr:anhydro-N-acetylmuramic acid kinase [Candidatus Methylomirabilis sp.]